MNCAIRNLLSSEIASLATDGRCVLRNHHGMDAKDRQTARWVASEFERTGKPQNELARKMGVGPSAITRILKGERKVSADELPVMREYFNSEDVPQFARNGVLEMDVYGGMGAGGTSVEAYQPDGQGGHMQVDGAVDSWGIPDRFLRNELRTNAEVARIIRVQGDSMEPTLKSGDRVVIDTRFTKPSPPGVYAVFDGISVVVKRVELIPLTDPPRVKLISDNRSHSVYEVTAEEAHIIGRVVAKVSLM